MVEPVARRTPEGVRADLLMTLARAWRAYREGRTFAALLLLYRASEQIDGLIALVGAQRDEEKT